MSPTIVEMAELPGIKKLDGFSPTRMFSAIRNGCKASGLAVFQIDAFLLMWSCGGVREICDSHYHGSKHRYERHQHHCRVLRTSWGGLMRTSKFGVRAYRNNHGPPNPACELSLRCPWHMLASVWSSSVLSLVRQSMTCLTCSYEAA